MADNLGGLVGAAAVGLGVGAADQVAIDTAYGQKFPGTTSWITGLAAAALGLTGHFALPQRERGWREVADALMVGGMTVVGQVAAHDADRALNRVAKSSGPSAPPTTGPTGPLPITTTSSSSGSPSTTTGSSSTGTTTGSSGTGTTTATYMFAATNYAELP